MAPAADRDRRHGSGFGRARRSIGAVIRLRSTASCSNTPRVVFALEELGLAYTTEVAPDGTFSKGWGSPGPTCEDGDVFVMELGAVLRHLVRRSGGALWPTSLALAAQGDRWIDFLPRRLGEAIDRSGLAGPRSDAEGRGGVSIDANNEAEVTRLLGFVEAQVTRGPWFLGEDFTIVDCVWSLLLQPTTRAALPMLPRFPALTAYLGRLAARPALVRAHARITR